MTVASSEQMAAASVVHAAAPNEALKSVLSLMLDLTMLKSTKSMIMMTTVTMKARSAITLARSDPTTPAPRERRKAMKLRPQAMGCRIMALVSAVVVSRAVVENSEATPAMSSTPAGE